MSQTTTDLAAVADALRAGERFLVTSHENPDGDALGSLLAMHLALVELGQGQRDGARRSCTPARRSMRSSISRRMGSYAMFLQTRGRGFSSLSTARRRPG